MSEEKKEEVEVRDLKPNKDAKGGRHGRHLGRRRGPAQIPRLGNQKDAGTDSGAGAWDY